MVNAREQANALKWRTVKSVSHAAGVESSVHSQHTRTSLN